MLQVLIIVGLLLAGAIYLGLGPFGAFSGGASGRPVLDPVKFQKFELVQKTIVSHNSAIYRFALPRKTDRLGLPIGQHISLQANINGTNVMCSYTPISTDAVQGYFDLLIKEYPTGRMSRYIPQMKIGDKIDVRGPKGFFKYTPNMVRHINMIAGGTGITPMYQIITAIASNPEDKTTVSLVFANVAPEDILLRAELEEIAAQHPQIKVHHVLNNPPAEGWVGSQGFVTAEIAQAQLQPPSSDSKLLLCGPLPMISAMKKLAVELGWEKPKPVSKAEHQVFVF